ESIVSAMTIYHDLQGQFYPGPLPQSIDLPSIEPARDGWVGFATYTAQQWKDFCTMIGRPELGQDERLYDGRARMNHIGFVQQAMHAWTREHGVDEILELATLLRIPCAPIGDGRRVLEFDQLRDRGVFQRSPHGFAAPRVPYQLETPAAEFARAPRLGEHEGAQLPPRATSHASGEPGAAPELPLR